MQEFNGMQYLAIDIGNSYGLDKELFETRIQWVKDRYLTLEDHQDEAKEKLLYMKGVKALRAAQKGEAIGHLVGFDSTASGCQIMSALSCDPKGAKLTNLTDPTKRYDCYTSVYERMCRRLGTETTLARSHIKDAIMTAMYGSALEPLRIFGDGKELKCFYEVIQKLLPGAWDLREDLIDVWQSYALEHSWVMPDGFHVHIKVMQREEKGIEIDELNHHKFTHTFFRNEGKKGNVSLAAK